jgi:hypothetical protein
MAESREEKVSRVKEQIFQDVLNIARLNTNGMVVCNGETILYSGYDIQTQIEFYRYRCEYDAKSLLLSSEV